MMQCTKYHGKGQQRRKILEFEAEKEINGLVGDVK